MIGGNGYAPQHFEIIKKHVPEPRHGGATTKICRRFWQRSKAATKINITTEALDKPAAGYRSVYRIATANEATKLDKKPRQRFGC